MALGSIHEWRNTNKGGGSKFFDTVYMQVKYPYNGEGGQKNLEIRVTSFMVGPLTPVFCTATHQVCCAQYLLS